MDIIMYGYIDVCNGEVHTSMYMNIYIYICVYI
jgi:hypothetical protein